MTCSSILPQPVELTLGIGLLQEVDFSSGKSSVASTSIRSG